MKLLTQKFYDILLKIRKEDKKVFEVDKNILKKHLEITNEDKDEIIDKLAIYFKEFYEFCFELNDNSMLKGEIKFKY